MNSAPNSTSNSTWHLLLNSLKEAPGYQNCVPLDLRIFEELHAILKIKYRHLFDVLLFDAIVDISLRVRTSLIVV